MPEEPPAEAAGDSNKLATASSESPNGVPSNPFSLAASRTGFGGKLAIGASATLALWPAPARAALSIDKALDTKATPKPAVSAAATQATPPSSAPYALMHLDVKLAGIEKQRLSVTVSCDATVGDLTEAVQRRLGDSKPVCLLFALTKLTCPTESLRSLGISSGHSLQLLRHEVDITPPLGRVLVPSVPSAVAGATTSPAVASLASIAAPTPSASEATSTSNTLRVRFVSARVVELPYDPDMTGMGLKRMLESRGEGMPASLRLLCNGKEIFDNAALALQKVSAGRVVDVIRREIPLTASSSSAGAAIGSTLTVGRATTNAPGPRRGRFVGLRNQGATCYLNSLLQSLYMTPSLSASIRDLTSSSIALPPLTKALVDLFAALGHAPNAVSTEALTSALRWGAVSRQQDVHEFWTLLCERLEGELKGTQYASIIESLFQGRQRDYVTCSECGTTSYRPDFFQDLKLAVPIEEPIGPVPFAGVGHVLGKGGEEESAAADASASTAPGLPQQPGVAATPATDIPGALRELLQPEQMRGEDQYVCECCGRKTDAERGVQLVRLPAVLALQLKRFRYDYRTGQRHKVNACMRFETTLDMAPYLVSPAGDGGCADGTECVAATHPLPTSGADTHADKSVHSGPAGNRSSVYELYAVLVHSGSASFGHYYALIKDVSSSEWYEFNDATVTPIKESDLQRTYGGGGSSSSAYMLLYRAVPSSAEQHLDTMVMNPNAGCTVKTQRMNTPAEAADPAQSVSDGNGEALAHRTKRLRLSPSSLESDSAATDIGAHHGARTVSPQGDAIVAEMSEKQDDEDTGDGAANPYFW